MRARRYYKLPALFRLYKAHVLPYAERTTPATFHAHSNVLKMLDRAQESFLDEISVSAKTALLDFNLAPLVARRDIAMLCLLHRTQIGTAPTCLSNFPECQKHII